MGVLRMSRDEVSEFSAMFIPVFVEQLAVSAIAMLVSFLVKGSGMEAVAAVNLLNTLNYLFQQSFMSIGVGVTVVVAQYRGRDDVFATGRAAQQGVVVAFLLSMVVGVVCFLFREPILRLILADSAPLIYEYGRTYLTYNLIALPFIGIYTVSAAAIRGSGYPRTSLFATLTYNGCYALLAFLAVTFTDMGLLGVSRALLISGVLAAGVGLWLLLRGNGHLQVDKLSFKLEKEVLSPMFKVGIPVLLENMLFQVGKLVTQTFSVPYGTNAMAANGIANNINSFMCVPGMTAMNAAPPIVGRYCGRGDDDGAMRKGMQFILLTTIMMVLVSLVSLVFLNPLSKMMSGVPEVQVLVKQILISAIIATPLTWPMGFVTPAILRSSGDAKFTSFVSIFAMFTMRIGMSFVLTRVLEIGIIGIWLGMYADWVVRIVFFMPRFKSRKWLQFSLLGGSKEEKEE